MSAASAELVVSTSTTVASLATGGPRAKLVSESGATPPWSPVGAEVTTSAVAASRVSAASAELDVSTSATVASVATGGPRAKLVSESGATPTWSPTGVEGTTAAVAAPIIMSAASVELDVSTSATMAGAATGGPGHPEGPSTPPSSPACEPETTTPWESWSAWPASATMSVFNCSTTAA